MPVLKPYLSPVGGYGCKPARGLPKVLLLLTFTYYPPDVLINSQHHRASLVLPSFQISTVVPSSQSSSKFSSCVQSKRSRVVLVKISQSLNDMPTGHMSTLASDSLLVAGAKILVCCPDVLLPPGCIGMEHIFMEDGPSSSRACRPDAEFPCIVVL